MEEPPPKFFEALEKYPGEMEDAKALLTGDDAYSKSLLALILTRISEDNDAQVAEMLPTIDTKDNDIAMMLCFMTYEYRLENSKGKNLIFKRFGKEVKAEDITKNIEVGENSSEPVENPEVVNEPAVNEPVVNAAVVNEPAVNEPVVNAAVVNDPKAVANSEPTVANDIDAVAEPKVEVKAPNQKGGSKKKRPSKLRKTKRVSRPSRPSA